MVTCIGTRSKKDLELNPTKQIIFPLIFGFIMFFGSICFLFFKEKGETNLDPEFMVSQILNISDMKTANPVFFTEMTDDCRDIIVTV